MKTWVFALLEAGVALFGLAAYFLADNIPVATTAAVLMAVLGIAQPILTALKQNKMEAYQEKQFSSVVTHIDDQVNQLFTDVIPPGMPNSAMVVAYLNAHFPDDSEQLIHRYEQIEEAFSQDISEANQSIQLFSEKIKPSTIGPYLQGLVAIANEDWNAAAKCFQKSCEIQPGWIDPWHGYITSLFKLNQLEELCKIHPHINSTEILPYGAGDEYLFVELAEDDREGLVEEFQQLSKSLGNYYAIAQVIQSKAQVLDAQQEYRNVA